MNEFVTASKSRSVTAHEISNTNDLREEANEYVREHIDEEWPFDSFDWDITQ